MLNRRHLLGAGLAAGSLVQAGAVWAAPEASARMLVVFLRGGYDAANVIIPTGSPFYFDARPTIRLGKPDPADPAAPLPLDADWSLHPALKDSIYPLWRKKQIAFVPFAGTEDMSRSHFETQDTIELGQPAGGSRNYRSGFLGRLNTELSGGRAIAFTDQVPLVFRGDQMIPNLALNASGKTRIGARQAMLIQQMYEGEALQPSVKAGFKVRDEVRQSMADEMMAANRGAVSSKGFEQSARQIGRLMRGTYNLGFVDVGGWDTHVNQGSTHGALASGLSDLGAGLAGYVDEIGEDAWRNTVVVVISEFGRTFRENGDRGTDHGHGSAYWVLGGGVSGGRMVGAQVRLDANTLNQGRDYPVLTEYRALLGGLMGRTFALPPTRLSRVFQGVTPAHLDLI